MFDSGRQPRGWEDSKVGTVDSRFRGKDGLGQIPPCGKTLQSSCLWVLASWILYESYQRFSELTQGHTHDLDDGIMLAVASTGLLINLFAAWTLYRSSRHSINVEGALWHILADLMGSIAVVISSVILLFFQWTLLIPYSAFSSRP